MVLAAVLLCWGGGHSWIYAGDAVRDVVGANNGSGGVCDGVIFAAGAIEGVGIVAGELSWVGGAEFEEGLLYAFFVGGK